MKAVTTSAAFRKLGENLVTRKDGMRLDERTFISFFGTTADILAECWSEINDKISGGRPKHLLWACMFMKLYLPEDVLSCLLGTTKPTMRKWVWLIIEQLALYSIKVIDFSKRKRNLPANAVASISVDGTDFKTREPHPFNPKVKSHKYNGAALKYEVAISIYSGDIVWVGGPYRGGKHDLTIFRESLMKMLDEGEMVEADSGYAGEPDWIRAKGDYATREDKREKNRVRARQESCNRRFKVWGILKQEFRHSLKKHVLIFRSIACITQMGIDHGDCLFGCEPTTKKKATYSIDDVDLPEA